MQIAQEGAAPSPALSVNLHVLVSFLLMRLPQPAIRLASLFSWLLRSWLLSPSFLSSSFLVPAGLGVGQPAFE